MKKMKRNVICMMILMGMSMESHAQQIDPALTGAVAAQSVMREDATENNCCRSGCYCGNG